MSRSLLHSPIAIRGKIARNRIVVSPMCTYASKDGLANDRHLIHLGRFALGGAGIVIVEATAVEERGRISHHDLGLWEDDQVAPLGRIVDALHDHGTIAGIQLSHAGRKAGRQPAWLGAGPLSSAAEETATGGAAWEVVGPTNGSAGPGWPSPAALSIAEIGDVVQAWQESARRADQAGFDLIELHGAHGYLLHSFWSPISNTRADEYGGSLENRMRFVLQTVEAVREVWPDEKPLFYRTSVVDGVPNGLALEDTFQLTEKLTACGVDVLDCSSAGVTHHQRSDPRLRDRFSTHAEFSHAIKQHTGAMVMTVGLIIDAVQAEGLLEQEAADLVGLGREMLNNPNWSGHSRNELDAARYSGWVPIEKWALSGRLDIFGRA
jgi:2,4-dienoyl-CoA reductase-like NADH-dependent reductase (Old Yellow Enzyme family)